MIYFRSAVADCFFGEAACRCGNVFLLVVCSGEVSVFSGYAPAAGLRVFRSSDVWADSPGYMVATVQKMYR